MKAIGDSPLTLANAPAANPNIKKANAKPAAGRRYHKPQLRLLGALRSVAGSGGKWGDDGTIH